MTETITTQIAVIGAGPGGYAAAFHAADKGLRVVLIERDEYLGGTCLNHGCIPSKALLHAAKIVHQARDFSSKGIVFSPPVMELEKLRAWKESVVYTLRQGIVGLAQKRKVEVVLGAARFEGSQTLRVETAGGPKKIVFEKAIVATGSKAAIPRVLATENKRVMTSTQALALEEIPGRLLVVGAGYIGLELGTVYAALGSKVVVVETLSSILSGADQDLVRPVMRQAEKYFEQVRLDAAVKKLDAQENQIRVTCQTQGREISEDFDRVLIAVGRTPDCDDLGLENTKVLRDDKGFIRTDSFCRTADSSIFALGDVIGGAMLAHKAMCDAAIAVDAMEGKAAGAAAPVIPAVVFTDPEVAWCGLTQEQARQRNVAVDVCRFPWAASGRALCEDAQGGFTKLICEPGSGKILGAGLVGAGAGELIGECVLAIEEGLTAKDFARSVHPHPTLSETLMECAQIFCGSSVHTLPRKK